MTGSEAIKKIDKLNRLAKREWTKRIKGCRKECISQCRTHMGLNGESYAFGFADGMEEILANLVANELIDSYLWEDVNP